MTVSPLTWLATVFRRLRQGGRTVSTALASAVTASGFALALLVTAGAGSGVFATIAATFDTFPDGTILGGQIEGVQFLDKPVVFTPSSTESPPRAIESFAGCTDATCSNGAYRLRMKFTTNVTRVSLYTGLDSAPSEFGTYARLVGYDAAGNFLVATPDTAVSAAIATPLEIADTSGRIASATLFVGAGTALSDTGARRAMLDSLSFDVAPGATSTATTTSSPTPTSPTTTAPPTTPTPPPTTPAPPTTPPITLPPLNGPTLALTSPADGTIFDRPDLVVATGTIHAPAGLNAFCISLDEDRTLPSPCNQATRVAGSSPDYTFDSVPVSGATPGAHRLTAWVQDLHGRVAELSVDITVHASGVDVRVLGIEVTQGVQTVALPAPDGRVYTTPGIPYGHPGAPYSGVKLVAGKKTVVRLFASAASTSGGPYPVEALLYGFHGSTPLPDSPLLPEYPGVRSLGTQTLATLRPDPNGAFTFTLPASWVGSGPLQVVGEVNPAALYPHVLECPACLSNNAFSLTDISLWHPPPLSLSTVEMEYDASVSSGSGLRAVSSAVVDPFPAFSTIRQLFPVADGDFHVAPYRGSVVVTGTIAHVLADHGVRALDRCGPAGGCYQDLVDALLGACEDWVDDYSSADEARTLCVQTGAIAGVTDTGNFLNDLGPAVVEARRRLTSVAHELFHLLGFVHASKACGGDSNGQVGEAWPPDGFGYTQSIGLDTRDGSGFPQGLYRVIAPPSGDTDVAATPQDESQWYDFMSYCDDVRPSEPNAWLSARNWNQAVTSRSRPVRSVSTMPRQATTSDSLRAVGPTLRVAAVVRADGTAYITRVERGGPKQSSSVGASPYRLVVRDAANAVLSDTGLDPQTVHGHTNLPPDTFLTAAVPARAAARVEIVHNGHVIASRTRSPNAPVVRVLAPVAGARVPSQGFLTVRWQAKDADGDPLTARVEYSIDDGRNWRTLALGVTGGRARLPTALLAASREARLRVSVDDGFNESSAVTGRFTAAGVAPDVHILSPAGKGARVDADSVLYLSGEAYDDRGRPLEGKSLRWLIGQTPIGTGSRVTASQLRPGLNRITLVAEDTAGRKAHATTVVRVIPVAPVFLTLAAPSKLSSRAQELDMRIASSIPATLTAAGRQFAVDRNVRTVALPVAPGTNTLQVELVLASGARRTTVTLSVPRD